MSWGSEKKLNSADRRSYYQELTEIPDTTSSALGKGRESPSGIGFSNGKVKSLEQNGMYRVKLEMETWVHLASQQTSPGTAEGNEQLQFKGPASKSKDNVTKLSKESDGQCYTRALQKECVCARELKQSLWGYDKRLRRAQAHTQLVAGGGKCKDPCGWLSVWGGGTGNVRERKERKEGYCTPCIAGPREAKIPK